VYCFGAGKSGRLKEPGAIILGGKGAGLAEMTKIGLPVARRFSTIIIHGSV